MRPFTSGFFHLARRFQGSVTLQHVSVVPSMLWPNSILLYEYYTLQSSTHYLMDNWAVAMMNTTPMSIHVPVFVWTYHLQFFWVYI